MTTSPALVLLPPVLPFRFSYRYSYRFSPSQPPKTPFFTSLRESPIKGLNSRKPQRSPLAPEKLYQLIALGGALYPLCYPSFEPSPTLKKRETSLFVLN